jgi:hypothetical protein
MPLAGLEQPTTGDVTRKTFFVFQTKIKTATLKHTISVEKVNEEKATI